MQPIKSFMKNCNLVSDSSVGDKKKAYSFYSIKGGLARFLGEKKEGGITGYKIFFYPIITAPFSFL